MRRQTATLLRIMLVIIAGSPTVLLQAQSQPGIRRPVPKILNAQPSSETSAVVGVMGQVRNPGTYQFAHAPTLDLAIASAEGLTPAASPMIRIVRGQRAAQRVSYPNAAQEKLQSGDVVIVDVQPQRDGSSVVATDIKGVYLALLGVVDRPLVVKVHNYEARIDLITRMLGQNPDSTVVHHIPPPNATRDSSLQLSDCSVLMFDRRKIDVAGLPDNLPKILPCTLPEPEIGGYGAHHALGERTRMEGMPPAWRRSPKPEAPIEVPPPAEVQDAVPIPRLQPDDQVAATFSSTERTRAGSPSVSTVPFSGSSTIAARPSRLTETAPSPATSAADVQEPAWNKLAPSDADELLDDEFDDPQTAKASGAFSFWQMLSILASAALLVGVALAVRASQQKSKDKSQRTSTTKEHRDSTASAGRTRSEPRATIPTPHIPLESFAAASPAAAQPPMAESREIRQQRFMQLIKNELPLIEKPLALQPGLPLITADEPKILLRRDDAAPADKQPHAPHIRTPSEQPAGQLIDRTHTRFASGPHQRAGVESPVERALRQLQGGRS